jgi:hypothetical protein
MNKLNYMNTGFAKKILGILGLQTNLKKKNFYNMMWHNMNGKETLSYYVTSFCA